MIGRGWRTTVITLGLVGLAMAPGPAGADDLVHLNARPQAAPAQAASAPRGIVRLEAGGVLTSGVLVSGVLYVPEGYRADRPAPLLVVLHGASQRGVDMARLFLAEARARGALLLAPDSQDYTWDLLADRKRNGEGPWGPRYGNDPARIDAALAWVFARYAVDAGRVALAGFSDGATYALSLGPRNDALFPVLMAFSPGEIPPVHTTVPPAGQPGAVRVFINQGTGDRVLPIRDTERTTIPALRRHGFTVDLRIFDGGHTVPADAVTAAFDWWLGPPPG